MSMFQTTPSQVKVSAVPPILRHMLLYGLRIGLLFGLIGQFIIRNTIENTLLKYQSIPVDVMQFILYAEGLSIMLAIVLILLVLRFRWQAPSWKAKFAHGFSIAFVFLLASHLFMDSINGALYNRDLWDVFFHVYAVDDPVFLEILGESIWNTIFEGMRFRVILMTLIPFGGGIAGLLLLRRNPEQSLPQIKDMFGSLAVMVLPSVMILILVINGVIYIVLGEQLQGMAVDAPLYNVYPLVPVLMIIPPLTMTIILQFFSIVWLITADVHTLHRKMLRISQFAVVTVQGFLIVGLLNFALPSIISSGRFPSYMVITSVVLAWAYGIAVQWKLYKFNRKRDVITRANWSSAISVSFGVITLAYLLIDMFAIGISRNLVIYSVAMIPVNGIVETSIQAILQTATETIWLWMLIPVILIIIFLTILTIPVLWISNLSEK